jgi:hypothetical protein
MSKRFWRPEREMGGPMKILDHMQDLRRQIEELGTENACLREECEIGRRRNLWLEGEVRRLTDMLQGSRYGEAFNPE